MQGVCSSINHIAFLKPSLMQGQCLLTEAPTQPGRQQLEDIHIAVLEPGEHRQQSAATELRGPDANT
jgi:hypothetical protein